MSEDHVLYDVRDGVATITLNRPASLNALSDEMQALLVGYTREAEHDPAVRCLVLRGAGRAFMAGGDVKGIHEDNMNRRAWRQARHETNVISLHQFTYQLRRMQKPVVAAVHGAVAGFGFALMLTADLVVARSDAFFTMAYRHIGLTADGGATYFLPRIVGERKALEIALLGDRFDAAAALEMGLVNWVHPEAEFEGEVEKLVSRLATGPTRALGKVKQLIRESFDNSWDQQSHREAESIAYAAASDDHVEGVAAFVEKRKPNFTGR
ncbi:MAG: enoyl-CoA hydratase-related protein [Flavobacteriaceae bacterium]